jgi:L-iditol 2-dehydrogenase
MKAFSLIAPQCLSEIRDYPESAQPGPGQVLLQVRAVGICGSDLHLYKAGHIGNLGHGQPVVPGHEFMGEVLQVEPEARDGQNNLLQPGQRVAVEPHLACLRCEWCERGDPNLCPHHTFIGLPGADGALRERMIVEARNCFPIPDELSDAAGALLEPLGVALHAVDLAKTVLGQTVAVVGCGPIGLLVLRLCHLGGAATLLAIDPHPARLAMARKWGASGTLEGFVEQQAGEALKTTNGRGFDIVFECAWTGPALPAAVEMTAPGGKVMLTGIPEDDDCHLPHSVARRKGLSLLFVRRMKHTYPRAIRLASGKSPSVPLDELVSHRFKLEETPQAFALNAAYADNIIKAVIEVS